MGHERFPTMQVVQLLITTNVEKTVIDRPNNKSFRCFVHIIPFPYECAETPIRNGLCNIKLYQQTCSTSSSLSHTTSYKCSPDSLPMRDVQRTKLLSHTHTNTPNRALRRKYHSLSQALPKRLENKIAVPPSYKLVYNPMNYSYIPHRL